jgi:hypothetical protein
MRQELKLLKQYNLSLRDAHSGSVHACQVLDPEFAQDWTHVLEFFMKYTSPGADTVRDLFTAALEHKVSQQASTLGGVAQLQNLREDVAEFRDRLSSKGHDHQLLCFPLLDQYC